MTMTLFTDLENEWSSLASSAHAADTLRQWANEHAPLRGFDDLQAVLHFAQWSGRRERSDEVLACLARRAREDPLAARTVLQAVLYGLIRIAADFRTATFSDEEIASVVVAAGYERIRTYPIDRRPRIIAANILLDTRQRVSRSLCRRRVSEVLTADAGRHAEDEQELSATEELLELVDEAVRSRRLRPEDALVIVLTRIADVPFSELAAERGCLPHSLRRRRLRAEAALAAAVA